MYAPSAIVGRHVIYELQEGNPNLLDDENFVRDSLTKAAEAANSTLLGLVSHKFEPQGVTAVALLAESHISIHTWPEHGYASVDCYTCGEHTDPEAAARLLKNAFESCAGSMQILTRTGTSINRDRSPALVH